MNKLLTTIILLCFSVAANADIYFCEGATSAYIDPQTNLSNNIVASDRYNWIVDTDKGFRYTQVGFDYEGSCELSDGYIICRSSLYFLSDKIFVISPILNFTYVSHLWGFTIGAYAGTCTKV